MICGVDEAGRGPVLGPLVVAGVALASDAPLRAMGVRDSKRLTPARRERLALRIQEVAEVDVAVVSAEAIDAARERMSLNAFEAELFARVIDRLRPETAYVDAADVDASAFRGMVDGALTRPTEVVSLHRADERIPVVSAASIVAKVQRDAEVRRIRDLVGEDVGSGYAHDVVTRSFLEKWIREKGRLPPHTRASWDTARRMLRFAANRTLDEFPGGTE
jgi:ribonuclease HII